MKAISVQRRLALLEHVAIHQYALIGEVEKDLDKVIDSLGSVEVTQELHTEMLTDLGNRFAALDGRVSRLDQKFTALDQRFAALDQRFTALDEKVSRHDEKFAVLDEKVSGLVEDMGRVLALLQPRSGGRGAV